MLLIFFAAIPGGILTFSCFVCCACSRFIHTGDDGHMRLKCCGKIMTGIGMCSMVIWIVEFPEIYTFMCVGTAKTALKLKYEI